MKEIMNMYFELNKDGMETFRIPLWLFCILFILAWKVCASLMVVGLFFDMKYSITRMNSLNTFFELISHFIHNIKNAFHL